MAVKKVDIFLLTLPNKNIDDALTKIISNNVRVEFLNPADLGGEWENVTKWKHEKSVDNSEKITLLDFVLSQYSPKVFLAGLQDLRVDAKRSDVDSAWQKKEELLEIAKKLSYFKGLEEDLKTSKSAKFQKKVEEDAIKINQQLNQINPSLQQAIEKEDKEAVIKLSEKMESLQSEKELLYSKTSDQLLEKLANIREEMKADNINPEVIGKKLYKEFAALYSAYESNKHLSKAKEYVFATDENSKVHFVFVAVAKSSRKKLERVLHNSDIMMESVQWDKDILTWETKGKLETFRNLAEGLGHLEEKEYDPTKMIAVFFMLFFAFCLADALYALVISSFTGYFLFTKKLNAGAKSFFSMFFFSGLATVLFGMFTGSWAGNLFNSFDFLSGINKGLGEFTLLNMGLDKADTSVGFLNSVLPADGPLSNPIVFMLLVSLGLGMLHVLIGNVLNVLNAVKAGKKDEVLESANWLLFILSSIGYLAVSVIAPDYSKVGLVVFGAMALGLFIFNNGKSMMAKIMGGLKKVYDLVSVAADAISYTRLVATGLTSAIIAIVVNMLAAGMIEGGGFGIIGGILTLLIGHTFNLVVAAFGAYINPLRLHYVEFMPKFFKGRGRKLEPQIGEPKYLILNG